MQSNIQKQLHWLRLEQWRTFKKQFDQFLVATQNNGVPDPVKVAIQLRVIGVRGNDISENFQHNEDENKDNYATVVQNFDSFCKPRVDLLVTRHKLFTQKQNHMSIDEFMTQLARECDFGPFSEDMVLRALTLGAEDDQTRQRLLEHSDGKLTLDKALQKCRAAEDSKEDMKALKDAVQCYTVQVVNTARARPRPSKPKYEAKT